MPWKYRILLLSTLTLLVASLLAPKEFYSQFPGLVLYLLEWQWICWFRHSHARSAVKQIPMLVGPNEMQDHACKRKWLVPFLWTTLMNGLVMQVDLTAYVEKHDFVFDAVLDDQVSNDEVRILSFEHCRSKWELVCFCSIQLFMLAIVFLWFHLFVKAF